MPQGLLGKPIPYTATRGLLTPVMWDRVRRSQGLLGTEGGGRGMGGGGGRGFTPQPGELPLRGGGERSRNVRHSGAERPTFDWRLNPDYHYYEVTLPKSGVRVSAEPGWGDAGGRQAMNIIFRWGNMEQYRGAGGARGSTKRGIETFSEVVDAVADLQRKFNPNRLQWSAATDKHKKIYDRMAPKISEMFGGTLTRPSPKHYIIDLP